MTRRSRDPQDPAFFETVGTVEYSGMRGSCMYGVSVVNRT